MDMDINIQREGHFGDSLKLTLLQIVLAESGLRTYVLDNKYGCPTDQNLTYSSGKTYSA